MRALFDPPQQVLSTRCLPSTAVVVTASRRARSAQTPQALELRIFGSSIGARRCRVFGTADFPDEPQVPS